MNVFENIEKEVAAKRGNADSVWGRGRIFDRDVNLKVCRKSYIDKFHLCHLSIIILPFTRKIKKMVQKGPARIRSSSKTSKTILNVLHQKEQENGSMASVSGKHYSSEEDMELRVIQRLQKQETKQFSGSEKQSSNEIVQYESI